MKVISGVLTAAERHDQMQRAIDKGFPFLQKVSKFHENKMSIVGFGPSLLDTWKSIKRFQPIMATSGAYDFLIERGLTPKYYTAIDPLQCTAKLLKRPQPGTQFLMASVVHPDFWEILEGYHVELWHLINDPQTVEWVRAHHPSGMGSLIGGDSTVAQRAMNVASALGYRRFDVFGMDCSFVDNRHAGPHTGEIQPVTVAVLNGREFRTTPQLIQSAREMEQFLLTMDVEVTFHGDGLMQEIARMIQKGK